jgi:hemolysin D
MGRYWDAIKQGIARDRADRGPRMNRDEREFQAAAIELLETPASPAARIFAGVILVFAAGAVCWSWFGRVETHAVLQGKLIPVGSVQVIEPLITGRIKAIHVKLGDRVEKGDPLVELDPAEYAAEREKLAGHLASAQVSAARLQALVEAVSNDTPAGDATFVPPVGAPQALVGLQLRQMRQSLAAHHAEQASLAAEIAQKKVEIERGSRTLAERRKLVNLSGDRLGIFLALEERGVGIKSNTIDARQAEQDQLLAVVAEEGRLAELDAAAATLAARMSERREAHLDKLTTELAETDREVATLRQDLAKATLFQEASLLRSPVSGRVQQLEVTTLGEVVQTGQRLMIVVPDGTPLEIEAMLSNRDRGFVRDGQDARVKLEAFPFTKYGTLRGKVLTVSNDAVPAGRDQPEGDDAIAQNAANPLVFPVRISLDQDTIKVDGAIVALTPGMSVVTEVRTGSRRVIEYLLDPLIEIQDEAFHER